MIVAAPTKYTKSTSRARSLRLGSHHPTSTTSHSRHPTSAATTKTNAATTRINAATFGKDLTWNQFLKKLYRYGDEVRRLAQEKIFDQILSAPHDGLMRGFGGLSVTQERRIVDGVVKRLAKEHDVPKGFVALSLRFAQAVDRITKYGGKLGRATVMSSKAGLSLEQIIRLSRGSPETIQTRLRQLQHQARR